VWRLFGFLTLTMSRVQPLTRSPPRDSYTNIRTRTKRATLDQVDGELAARSGRGAARSWHALCPAGAAEGVSKMAVVAQERNYNYYTYVSDDGNTYTVRTSQFWGALAASGLAASAGHPIMGRATKRRHPRYAVYQDNTSFRTFRGPVGTAAAFAALSVGSSTVTVPVAGLETGVVYTLKKKIAEAVPGFAAPRQAGQPSAAT
jgi:hypothetical protein